MIGDSEYDQQTTCLGGSARDSIPADSRRRESHNSQRSPTAIWKLNIICQRFAIISLPTSHSSNKLSFARFGVCSPPPERWKAFATRLKHSYPSQSSLSSKNKAVFGYKIYSPAMKMMSTLTQQVDLVGNTFALISISKNKQKVRTFLFFSAVST